MASSSPFFTCLCPATSSPVKKPPCRCTSPPPVQSSDNLESFSNGHGCSEGEGSQRLSKKIENGDKVSRDNLESFSNGHGCNSEGEGSQRLSKKIEDEDKVASTQLLPCVMPWEFDLIESESAILPWEQDILLLDINKGILESTVSNVLQRPYLKPWVGPSSQWPVEGKVFGVNNRLMISLSTSLSAKKASEIQVVPIKIAVHYIVDTGAPTTFLCEDALQALSPTKKFYYDEYTCIPVLIQGCKCQINVSPFKSHFKDVSVIGSDLLSLIHAKLIVDYGDSKDFSLVKGPNVYEPNDD